MELRVGGKYKVTKRLGQGAFGDIYAGVNVKTNEEVAIKLVSILHIVLILFFFLYRSYWSVKSHSYSMRLRSIKFFKETVSNKLFSLQTFHLSFHMCICAYFFLAGIPTIYWFGVEGEYTVLIMSILGPNLHQLFAFCEYNFTLKQVLIIAMQMVQRIEYFHSKSFIHRDIKPENIMVGQGKKANTIFLVDFGLAKRYLCPRWGTHVPFKSDRCLIGTERFLSLSGH